MAICLRRALATRGLLFLRAPRNFSTRTLSPFSHLVSHGCGRGELYSIGSGNRLSNDFFFLNRRGFAKGKKSKNEDEGDTVQVVPDIGPTVKSGALSQMEAAIVALSRELSKLRTGRASAGMLDHIIVETGGVKVPMNRVAVVSVLDAQTLSVTPYDPDSLKAVEHAIIASPLGLNPTPDGQRILAAIPPLTKENMQALCKIVAKSAEDVKQSIRRARQKALDSIKKAASSISKDDVKRLEKEIDDMTKRFVKSADDMCKAKEKEIAGS
ncbi:uncharacterized protein [Typha angustifolia]|uniref:uncharacterized protein n=1 Tax=Typha angustifolia TaxID=59011 RepID=UPI003C2FA06B